MIINDVIKNTDNIYQEILSLNVFHCLFNAVSYEQQVLPFYLMLVYLIFIGKVYMSQHTATHIYRKPYSG
jgi:hypothetical protein